MKLASGISASFPEFEHGGISCALLSRILQRVGLQRSAATDLHDALAVALAALPHRARAGERAPCTLSGGICAPAHLGLADLTCMQARGPEAGSSRPLQGTGHARWCPRALRYCWDDCAPVGQVWRFTRQQEAVLTNASRPTGDAGALVDGRSRRRACRGQAGAGLLQRGCAWWLAWQRSAARNRGRHAGGGCCGAGSVVVAWISG